MTGSQRSMTSRRGFLRYTGMGALAIGSAGLLAACGDDGEIGRAHV